MLPSPLYGIFNSNTTLKVLDFSQIHIMIMMTIKGIQTPKFDLFAPFFGTSNSIFGRRKMKSCLNQKSYIEKDVFVAAIFL